MNPNGQNQWWSLWKFRVEHKGLGTSKPVTREELKTNLGRFARKMFGSAGTMAFDVLRGKLEIKILVENAQGVAHDPAYCDYVRTQWTAFLVAGFGPSTVVTMESKLMSGSRQDGTPSDQMVVLPSLALN